MKKTKIPIFKLIDLIIWVLLVIFFIYKVVVNEVENKPAWIIMIILIIMSIIIKLVYWRKRKII